MLAKNKKIQKLISSLIIISMLTPALFLFSAPKKADAIFGFGDIVFDPAHTAVTFKIVAQEIFKQFVMLATRRLLDKMTQSTINWINSGFHGSPLYLENPGSFFKDIAKLEIRTLVNQFGYDPNRFPFGRQFALNVIDSYKRTLNDNASYTLSNVINDPALLERYRNDFNVSGWNGFLVNTQYPQNNYLGFQILAGEELARRLEGTTQNTAQKVQTTLQQGLGFLSPQTCPSNPNYPASTNPYNPPVFTKTPFNPPPYDNEVDGDPDYERYKLYVSGWEQINQANKESFDTKYSCPGGLVNTTPGSVVASQIFTAMSSKQRQGELGAALGNSLAAIFDALLSKFMNSGLNALSNKINPPPEPNIDPNDFMYLGDSINSTRKIVIPPSPTPNAPLGTCTTPDQEIPNQTQEYCTTVGGTSWTENEASGTCTYSNGSTTTNTAQNICTTNGGTWTAATATPPPATTTPATPPGNTVVNGRCGAANGQIFSFPPTTNLCAEGNPSAVTGTGPSNSSPWHWTCSGSGGGSDANCSTQ